MHTIKLNQEQENAVEAMLEGQNVFLTGKAGTGKSTVINEFINRNNKPIFILAPTQLAARNLIGLPTNEFLNLYSNVKTDKIHQGKFSVFSIIKIILIDQISMLNSTDFYKIDKILRTHTKGGADKPFGGKQIIVAGDFAQIPPVHKWPVFFDSITEFTGNSYPFEVPSWQGAKFKNIVLRTSHRQIDNELSDILDKIRYDKLSAKDIENINSKCYKDDPTDLLFDNTSSILCMTERNLSVWNKKYLDQFSDKGIIVDAINYNESYIGAMNPNRLHVKKGARMMLTEYCLSVEGDEYEYESGDSGTVVDYDANGKWIDIKLDSKGIVRIVKVPWNRTLPGIEVDSEGKRSLCNQHISCSLFPLTSAKAISIQRAQGKTFFKILLDHDNNVPYRLIYTAFSRVNSLDDIRLTKPLIKSQSSCMSFMEGNVINFYQQLV